MVWRHRVSTSPTIGWPLATGCGLSRFGGGWSVAAEDFAVGAAGFGGAVGVEDEGPAEAVDADLVVVLAEHDEVGQAGLAAVGAVHDVVDLASGGGLLQPPGHAQCRSRRMTRRRRWSGMPVTLPASRGRGLPAYGAPSWRVRR
jgi:hypothetical protein